MGVGRDELAVKVYEKRGDVQFFAIFALEKKG
jgi:hypothetical protein